MPQQGNMICDNLIFIDDKEIVFIDDKEVDVITNFQHVAQVATRQVENVSLGSPKDVTKQQLTEALEIVEPELWKIFTGKVKCERHQMFKNGGCDKASLKSMTLFGAFTEEQEEMITNYLMKVFCSKHKKYFDYVMKVLLPETLKLVYGNVFKVNLDQAEEALMKADNQSINESEDDLFTETATLSTTPDFVVIQEDTVNTEDTTNSVRGDELHQEILYLKQNPLQDMDSLSAPSIAQDCIDNKQAETDMKENLLVNIGTTMPADVKGAGNIFPTWPEDQTRTLKTQSTRCPFCGHLKTNLKNHVMRIHNVDSLNASGLKSQLGELHKNRVAKKRKYKVFLCPVSTCSKVVKRIHNHLKSTHKIEDKKLYSKLLGEAVPYLGDMNGSESEAEFSDIDEGKDTQLRRILKKGGANYLSLTKDVPVNSDDSSDEDWLELENRKLLKESLAKNHDISEKHQPEVAMDCTDSEQETLVTGRDKDQESENDKGDESDNEENEDDHEDFEDEEDDSDEGVLMTPWQHLPAEFEEFQKWLISPDGKAKPVRQAVQHVQQVIKILRAVSQNTFEFQNLFDRKKVRDDWLILFENSGKKPATIKAYISSLRQFYSFIISDEPKDLLHYKEKCQSLLVVSTNWISLYRKKQSKGRWKKELEQLTQLFTAEDIKRLDSSELVKYCKGTFNKFKVAPTLAPTLREFSNARDYLLMYLCLDNASRTGALANMTVGEFQQAKFIDGSYRINVANHKTIATSGPACIVATHELYKEIVIYFELMRNVLEGVDSKKEDPLFISWSGKKMSSPMVTAQINSFWGKAVGHSNNRPRISANLVRKSAVSKVHTCHTELKKDLANLMCHSEETASRIYFLQEKTKKAGETSSSLRSLLRKPDKDEEVDKAIRTHFREEIKKKKISITVVREKKDKSELLKSMPDAYLRDKIRYFIQKEQLQNESQTSSGDDEKDVDSDEFIPEVECEDNSGDDAPPHWPNQKGRKKRVVFPEYDLNDIHVLFKELIEGSPSKKIRMGLFDKILEKEQVKRLHKKYGTETLLSKVRTERKKFLLKK